MPWSREIDELFFSRQKKGLAAWMIPRGSPIYYEFEGMRATNAVQIVIKRIYKLTAVLGFYSKLKGSIKPRSGSRSSSKVTAAEQLKAEGTLIRHALVLFHDFQQKKKAALKEKIESTGKSCPSRHTKMQLYIH